jgi:hypothetical protein
MGDHGILNEDVKTRSFIVKKDTRAESGYKVVMIKQIHTPSGPA